MQTDIVSATNSGSRQHPEQIASWKHLAGFLLIGAGIVALGIWAQHASGPTASPGQFAHHTQALPIYLSAIFMDWALLYYCWVGAHHRGGNLWALAGGRWTSWKSVAIDCGIALPFWVLWEATAWGAHGLLGASSAKTVDSLLPKSLLEILVWIATSITAGICEEMAFRGYLQRQFHALTGNIAVAILAQGLIFGLFHAYQGWKNVIVISILGVLFGALAAWRKNLRANIMVHAWADVWGGWLQSIVMK
jgi:membrane protease YdiL (CAAX protease family)